MKKMGGALLEMGEVVTQSNLETAGLLEKGVNKQVLRFCNFLGEKPHKPFKWYIFFFLQRRFDPYSFKARLLISLVWVIVIWTRTFYQKFAMMHSKTYIGNVRLRLSR